MKEFRNEEKQIYNKMAHLCSRSEQCRGDILKKILTFGLEEEQAEELVQRLIDEKFIDDRRFARAYANDKFRFNHWGKIKIQYYLRLKGLSDDDIEEGLSQIDDQAYQKLLIRTMKEKAKTIKKKTAYEKLAQVIRFTQSRGFEAQLIHRFIDKALN